jgi:hypothetical protein
MTLTLEVVGIDTLMLYFMHVTLLVLLRAGIWFVLQVHM